MRVAVCGAGYVGLVTAACLAELGHDVTGVDHDRSKVGILKKGRSHFYEPDLDALIAKNAKRRRLRFSSDLAAAARAADVVFIAVGTPPRDDGGADLSQIEKVACTVASTITHTYKLIVEKSTVPVRTGERIRRTIASSVKKGAAFDVASNPEFLREGSAIRDFLSPDRIVVGAESFRARAVLKELYRGIDAPILFTDTNSAELIKHASNSFLAMKISFINAVARVCELAGADIGEVADGMGFDRRIGRSFLNAGIGFGGFCFPKDLAAFIHISDRLGYDFRLLKAVLEINDDQRRFFLKKVHDALRNPAGKKIAVWGLAFKPDTDDMRYAPSVPILTELLAQGADVAAFDPKAAAKARALLPKVRYSKDLYAVCRGADCLMILTEWEEFKKADLGRVKRLLRTPLVLDGRNLFEPARMKKAGFRYVSIGRRG